MENADDIITLGIHIIEKYFPNISDTQKSQLMEIGRLYPDWNDKINVISRKDISNLYIHHILHSLSIGKFLNPICGTTFIDVGTGGGFPGIPMAIMFPECKFHLIDRIGKKIKVSSEIAGHIGLRNVTFQHGDLGECHQKFDFAVSRAVMELNKLYELTKKNIKAHQSGNAYPNGLIVLKGGELEEEIRGIKKDIFIEDLSMWFSEEFFKTKKLIYIPV